ncbi:MAG: hypothetical protein JNK00_08505 [Flavipsychrobacter sp.]|nr:hypothetical protein [Flavipsychrobacter sp.]
MKKIALFMVAAVAIASCKKDYVCKCTSSATIPGFGTTDSSFTVDINKSKKKDAESKCKANENSSSGSYMGFTFSYTTKCSI